MENSPLDCLPPTVYISQAFVLTIKRAVIVKTAPTYVYNFYIIPAPIPGFGIAGSFSLIFATTTSVVRSDDAIDAAF